MGQRTAFRRGVRPALHAAALASALMAGMAAAARPAGAQTTLADSAAAREAAVAAQHRFEAERVRAAPWARPGPRRGACDEVVGRFCFWHDSGDDGWRPPPDPPAVVAARDSLLAELAAAARWIPGDGWVAGQRVRYLAEAGRHAEAASAAAACRAEPAWCGVLAGYALHAAGDASGAEAAFDDALARMPTDERAAWEDLEPLLTPGLAREWRAMDGAARADWSDRLWWLADPLWSRPGNGRRAEHYARHVLDRLQKDARSGYDVAWGRDLRELLIRYGWPSGFERSRGRTGSLGYGGGDAMVARDPPGGRGFLPPAEALADPASLGPGAWRVDDPEPRSAFAPRGLDRFLELEPQIAVFGRGSDLLVVAAWELPADSLPADAPVETALAVAAGPDDSLRVLRSTGRGPAGRVHGRVPAVPSVVSLEVVSPGASLAARARHGLPPPGTPPALSDLLLLSPGAALPATAESAAAWARGRAVVRPGEPVGVFWEGYPPPGTASVRWSVELRDERGGFWRGVGSALGLTGPAGGAVALEWEEPLAPGLAAVPRSVRLHLPPDLPEGAWTLALSARFDGEPVVRAERRIRVVRPRVVPSGRRR